MPLGIFIIWILYLPSSHGLLANNFQPALQIELLGSRTVGPGTAESTHSAWTETAACSLPSSWPQWIQSLLACGPPQPAEIFIFFRHLVISLTSSAASAMFHNLLSGLWSCQPRLGLLKRKNESTGHIVCTAAGVILDRFPWLYPGMTKDTLTHVWRQRCLNLWWYTVWSVPLTVEIVS